MKAIYGQGAEFLHLRDINQNDRSLDRTEMNSDDNDRSLHHTEMNSCYNDRSFKSDAGE
jgi:hypothetical protein